MYLQEIDGELNIMDENHDVAYVFTRERDTDQESVLSRAAYKHMCAWVKTHWKAGDDPDALWERAEAAWDALTPNEQMYMWSIVHQEEQNAQDLCTALLAHLSEYRGFTNVKEAFYSAIRGVLERFTESRPSSS